MSKKKKVSSVKAVKKSAVKKVKKQEKKPSAGKKSAPKVTKSVKKPAKIVKKPLKVTKPVAKKSPPVKSKSAKTVKKPVPAKNIISKSPTKPSKAPAVKGKVQKPLAKKVEIKKSTAPATSKKANSGVGPKKIEKPALKPVQNLNGKGHKNDLKKPDARKDIKANGIKPQPVSFKPQPEIFKKNEDVFTKKQIAEKRANDVLAITNTIPVKQKNEISQSKIASISHSITNPIKRTDSYAVKPEKEPNGKFEMEFVVHASAEMLYEFLSTPSGLSEWFCDDLNIRNGIYTFIWEDQLQQARLLKTVELQLVRFQWVDKTDGSYFEFRIQRDDLTNDISLIITDFADTSGDRESSKLLWHSQIEKLMHVLGSIF